MWMATIQDDSAAIQSLSDEKQYSCTWKEVALNESALLKFDIQCKMSAWIKNLNSKNAGATIAGKADSITKKAIFVQRLWMATIQ